VQFGKAQSLARRAGRSPPGPRKGRIDDRLRLNQPLHHRRTMRRENTRPSGTTYRGGRRRVTPLAQPALRAPARGAGEFHTQLSQRVARMSASDMRVLFILTSTPGYRSAHPLASFLKSLLTRLVSQLPLAWLRAVSHKVQQASSPHKRSAMRVLFIPKSPPGIAALPHSSLYERVRRDLG
jgi:hypothetical protein